MPLDFVRAIREAVPLGSGVFIIVMALAFSLLGAGVGWLIDRTYQNAAQREHRNQRDE